LGAGPDPWRPPFDHRRWCKKHCSALWRALPSNANRLAVRSMTGPNLSNFSRFVEIADKYLDPASVRVVLDVGSRDAEVALYLKEHYANANVYAFECNPVAIELCKQNIAGRPGVFLVEKAVSDVTGELDFYAVDDVNIGAASLYVFNPEHPQEDLRQRKISVPSTTLADWARDEGIDQIDVIWIDLQGAELRAFRGLGELINSIGVIYTEVEYTPIYEGQPLEDQVRRYLTSKGFLVLTRFYAFEAWFGDELYCHERLLPWGVRIVHNEFLQRTGWALGGARTIWMLRIGRILARFGRHDGGASKHG
jgi:FkbM family methyltransferase